MLRLAVITLLLCGLACADKLVLSNGDQLSGELVSATADTITFKTALAGVVTVSVKDVRELRTDKAYAVVEKQKLVSSGPLQWTANNLSVSDGANAAPVTPDPSLIVVERGAWERAVTTHPGLTHGWTGDATAGFSLIRATQNDTSLNGLLSLTRTTPTVTWLDPHSRTLFNVSGAYGHTSQKGVSDIKTEILHLELEHDRYFTPRLFGFAITDFDHNFAQGLSLQQGYGLGLGWSAIRQPNQTLDFRADVRYTRRSFLHGGGERDLVGSQLSEKYYRKLPHSMVFDQQLAFTPSFNDASAYEAHGSAALTLPLYGRFHLSFGVIDSYLNEPGPGSKKNSFQFLTGLQYAFKEAAK